MTKKKSLFGFVKKVRDFLFPTKKALACVSETWESLQVYTTTKNVSFKPFVELKQLACPAHSCLGGKLIDSIQPFHSHTKSVVLRIGRQGAYFAHNHLLDSAHNVIYHPFVQFSQLPISNKNLPRNVKKKRGTIAYLSNTAADHYGHWLRLILPMLRLYAKEVDLADIDCFYVGDVPIKPFMQETLEMFGILPAKILNYPCTSDMILIACNRWEIQEKNRYLDWESANFVKQGILSHLLAKQTAPLSVEVLHNCCYAPRIYVSRGNVNWRKVVNEEEVLTLMKKYDFECRILDKISVEEQFKIFYFAKIIVAPHGSALTNLMFAQPNTKVLEIYPQHYADHAGYDLAYLNQCAYYYMDSQTPDGQASVGVEYQDMYVDITHLELNLQKLL